MKCLAVILLAALLSLTSLYCVHAVEAPLADEVEKQNRAAIASLIEKKADVNATQVDGMTALHWAAYLDDTETVRLLLDASANVHLTNRYGLPALSLACQNGNGRIVKLLLEAGADANTSIRGGETPLMTAARTGKPGPVSVLIRRGANANTKDHSGQTALMWASADGHAEVVDLLLKAGADLNARLDNSGYTAFFFAVREGRAEVVQTLLKARVDVNETMQPKRPGGRNVRPGTSPLILAIENGHFELALALIKAGADPNDARTGFTPLHTMTWVRKPNRGDGDDDLPPPLGSGNVTSLEFVRSLVKLGADVNARLKTGKTGRGNLGKNGATPFLLAADTADIPLMRLLVELGADPLLPNADNATPLMAAAGLGTLAPGEEAGTDEEALEATQLALELGGDINAVDNNGETAMHGAAYKGIPRMVHFLAEKGAKVEIWNRTNKYGWTPSLIAEGYRPGNFRPAAETLAALHKVMLAAGVTPVITVRPAEPLANSDYQAEPAKKVGP